MRRFSGVIDAAFTLAIGSVCAFGLTLGPAPLNTVAASSAAAAEFSNQLNPAPHGIAVTPLDEDTSSPREADAPPDASPEPQRPSPSPTVGGGMSAQAPPASASPDASPTGTQKLPDAPRPETLIPPVPVPGITPALAVSVVEAYRVAAGLGAFVTADACAESTVHSTVVVTPSAVLPPGLAKKSLARDPAYATASGAVGAVSVTIHACQ